MMRLCGNGTRLLGVIVFPISPNTLLLSDYSKCNVLFYIKVGIYTLSNVYLSIIDILVMGNWDTVFFRKNTYLFQETSFT